MNTEKMDPTFTGPQMKINFSHPDVIKGVKNIMNPRKIIEYTIFYSNERPECVDLSIINNLIQEGWQPYGFPYEFGTGFGQAMVKYET